MRVYNTYTGSRTIKDIIYKGIVENNVLYFMPLHLILLMTK